MKQLSIAAAAALSLIGFVFWWANSNNVKTEAGYVGYVTQGAIFGKKEFVGIQVGPTSSGLHWKYSVQNISITPYNEDELWKQGGDIILAKDKLPLLVDAHIIWRIKADRIEEFMTKYGGLAHESPHEDEVEQEAYTTSLASEGAERVREITAHLNAYKDQLEVELIAQNGSAFIKRQKGQLKLDNSVLEEFLIHLIHPAIIPGLPRDLELSVGPTRAFMSLSFHNL